MASRATMRHKDSGIVKTGYYGFSWTTLFFGSIPALCRGDFLTFVGSFAVDILMGFATAGAGIFFAGFVWAFFYNAYYTRRLLERGYHFADSAQVTAAACIKLGVIPPTSSASALAA